MNARGEGQGGRGNGAVSKSSAVRGRSEVFKTVSMYLGRGVEWCAALLSGGAAFEATLGAVDL